MQSAKALDQTLDFGFLGFHTCTEIELHSGPLEIVALIANFEVAISL